MGKASSSKKVQRAARAAASSRGASERRELGFPITIAVVVVLGVLLVVLARDSREAPIPPQIDDHWHVSYGVYNCDQFADPFSSSFDPDGIHSHQDGVIHIHPFNSSATGADASVGVFLEAMGARIDEDEISGPGMGVIETGGDCNGQPTEVRAARFDPEGALIEEFTTDFEKIRFLDNQESVTFAVIPVGEEIPPPPIERRITAAAASGELLSSGPETEFDPEDLFRPEETGATGDETDG